VSDIPVSFPGGTPAGGVILSPGDKDGGRFDLDDRLVINKSSFSIITK
jgi:hypothetical protein